jgi:hypothetical protein
MLKQKLTALLSKFENASNVRFEIINDQRGALIAGGQDICNTLTDCAPYSGNEGTCPNLVRCGNFTET